MSHQRIYPALKEGLRPCVSSRAIPRRVVIQPSQSVSCVPPQSSGFESSPTAFHNEEQYCNVNSCLNSHICIKIHPKVCPHGLRLLRGENDESQELCDQEEAENNRESRVRVRLNQTPRTSGITTRNDAYASVLDAEFVSSPSVTQIPLYCDKSTSTTQLTTNSEYNRISTNSSITPFPNGSTQTRAVPQADKSIEYEPFVESSCRICRRLVGLVKEKTLIDGLDQNENCKNFQYELNTSAPGTACVDGGLSKRILQLVHNESSCNINPQLTQLNDEIPYSTCAPDVQLIYSESKTPCLHSTYSATSLVESEADKDSVEKPMFSGIHKTLGKTDPNIDELTQKRDSESSRFHLKLSSAVHTSLPPQNGFVPGKGCLPSSGKAACKNLTNENKNRDEINEEQDSNTQHSQSILKSKSPDHGSGSNIQSGMNIYATPGAMGKSNIKNFNQRFNKKSNKEQDKNIFMFATPEDISPPIRIVSGLRVCDACRQPVQSATKHPQRLIEESACASTVSPVKEQARGCTCHFPPAYKQYGCTGNISGNCECSKQN